MTQSLKQRLLAAAQKHATRPALWVEGDSWDYATLFADAQALADQINQQIDPKRPLGIHCQRDRISLLGILAAILSGRAYVPLNPGFPADRLRKVAKGAALGAVLCSEETQAASTALMEQLPQSTVLFDAAGTVLARGAQDSVAPPAPAMDDSTIYMMFTSGTTGEPKGVRVLDRNVTAYLDGIAPIADLDETDHCTQFFDLSFDLSVHDVLVTWTAGAALSVLPKQRAMQIVDFVNERQITSWFSVPSLAAFCERLGQLQPGALPTLRKALFCGEPLATAMTRRFAEAAPNARLWNLYGPTEATIAFSAYEISRPDPLGDRAIVPLGWPIGDQVYQIGGDGSAPGELLLGGSQVTPGYINNPEQTAAAFFTGPGGTAFYRSGDLAEMSVAFGALFCGRIDDQVKVNGYRVELLEIDAVLRAAGGTPEVAALAWPVSETGHADQIVAFLTSPTASPAAIKKHCRQYLPAYMVPRKIITVDAMPLSASGKIDRKALRQQLEDSAKDARRSK